jgi:hypothetical protein
MEQSSCNAAAEIEYRRVEALPVSSWVVVMRYAR